ncbi:MAG TPA: MotA/TolQ/ExbB proton channel family protein [Leptospiraceae bacterium]|nr:MotA/TolQ/ExbB proton channel family protein [Leptospiraceae bacterium]HMW04327.1 MotA/TolQ/ExbB proton channel family protein [Leptospiraceae bacterium]HMX31103.1 MotA/TolQ/ExbB proton channel family protein [Leptospiraceae bacterium]HMY31919.1 MotA/TolQ/ExbB proton channel family protein [Leptospiraceae bacterium]HMZ65382.1 MotA/TolQ/ExbB proton channel family protein [Leptospiraceae bacterium]
MITTYLGIFLAFLSVIIAIILEGAHIGAFFKLSAIVLIVGGTLGATVASFSVIQIKAMLAILNDIITQQKRLDFSEIFIKLLEKTRRDGLLSLEDEIESIDNDLAQKGLRLIVDGTDPSTVEDILFEWSEQKQEVEMNSAKILETAGGFCPTIGIIGTVMGLVHVLENLGAGTTALGQGIATAFIATFYGIGFANLVFLPIANKVKAYSRTEHEVRQAVIRGLLSIQAGDNKRIMLERMSPFLES